MSDQFLGKMPLAEVIRTEELTQRASREPDYEAENRAILVLNEVMASAPETLLQALVDAAPGLCRADSAGISILESENGVDVFRWHAVAGMFASHRGYCVPRDASPCGIVIDRNESILFVNPSRHVAVTSMSSLPIGEALVVPFHVGGKPVGTFWVATHSSDKRFDCEDQRLLRSLSRVASAGHQLVCSMRAATTRQLALEERSLQLRNFLDNAATGLFQCNRELHCVAANVAFATMAGRPLDQMIGRAMDEVIGREALNRLMPDLQRVLAGEQFEREIDVLLPTGRTFAVHGIFRPERDLDGHVTGLVASLTDMTLRKRAEASLRTSEEQFRAAFEVSSVGMVQVEPLTGRFLRVNRRFCEMTRFSEAELLESSFSVITHPDDQEADRSGVARLVRGEMTEYRTEKRFVCKNGAVIWADVTVNLVRDPDHNAVRTVAVIQDITQRKQAEQELLRSREQLVADSESLLRLSEASTRLWRSPDLEEGLRTMLDATMNLLSADRGNVQLLDQQRGVLRIAAQRGFGDDFLRFFEEVSTGDESACGRALRSGERSVIEDIETDPAYAPYRDVARAAGYRSVQSTPLLARDGTAMGMLSTHWNHPYSPDENSLRRLDLFARLAADFIEHEQLSQSLRDSRKRLQLFIEHAPVAIAMFDRDMRYLAVSRRWISEFHLEGIELQGRGHYDVFPELPERWKEAHRRGMAGETVGSDEDQYIHRDGTIEWIHWEVRPWHIFDSEVGGIVVLVEDITARKQAALRLHDREARLKAVLDTATDAIISIDEQGLMTSINEAGLRMFGYTLSELKGRNVNMLMPAPFHEEHDGYIRRYVATGERRIIGRSREAMALRRDGSTFPVELAVAEIDQERQFTGFIRDISERKELQRHVLEAAEAEQQRLGSELHDGIQQELTAISLFAGLMRRLVDELSASLSCEGRTAEQERGHTAVALQQLSDVTERLIRGLQETYQHVRDLAHGILPVAIDAEGLRAALEKLSSTMSTSSGVPCNFIWSGDIAVPDNSVASHVYRIAQEAINNSIHHGKPSRVDLSLSGHEDHLLLEISDDGNGGGAMRSGNNGGKGLKTMEYRAGLIGGALRIERSQPGGTLIRCLIPRTGNTTQNVSVEGLPNRAEDFRKGWP